MTKTTIYFGVVCAGLLFFPGCGGREIVPNEETTAIEVNVSSTSESDTQLEAELMEYLNSRTEKSSAANDAKDIVSAPSGTTGDDVSFDLAPAGTTGDDVSFDLAPAGTTGDDVSFDLAPAGTTGDDVSFDLAPAGTTGDDVSFDLEPAGTTGDESLVPTQINIQEDAPLENNDSSRNTLPSDSIRLASFFLDTSSLEEATPQQRYAADQEVTLPPMADLEQQLQLYFEKMARDVEDLGLNPNFADGVESLYRDANVFILVALAIGKSSEESDLKAATPGLIAAAQNVITVQNLDEAKSALLATQAAFESKGDPASLKWEKVSHLSPLMKKALPNMTTEIKRLSRNEKTFRRESNVKKVQGSSATIAVVAIGCLPNVDETLAPDENELWESYCQQLYQTALAMNAASHSVAEEKAPFAEFTQAFKELDATCNTTCHEKFGGGTE